MRLRSAGRWSASELGFPAHATFRVLQALPQGGLAAGCDYGMALYQGGRWRPFPFPQGARREMRAILDAAWLDGTLHLVSERGSFQWSPGDAQAQGRGLPKDGAGGYDDLRAVHAAPSGLLRAWRSHLEGAEGPPECLSFVTGWQQRVFAGTRDGQLWELGVGPIRSFEREGKGRPVRHLSMGAGHLWAAAAGALWRWDGSTWTRREGEPYALTTDPRERLWSLERGALWCSELGDPPTPIDWPLERPWQLCASEDRLWIGRRGGIERVVVETGYSP